MRKDYLLKPTRYWQTGCYTVWFSIEQLKKLQAVSYQLSGNTSNFINQNITQRRELATKGELNKVEMVQFVNFIESQLQINKRLLEEFIEGI